jgi:LacI family transcriptional regulator
MMVIQGGMSDKQPTLKEIADRIGCSKNTVSLALRNSTRVSAKVREQVQAVARELNYRPNARVNEAMSYVRSHKKTTIKETLGILVDWPVSSKAELSYNQHLTLIFNSFEKRAEELGYVTNYLFLCSPEMTEKRMDRIIRSRGIRGIVITPMEKGPAKLGLNMDSLASIQIGRTLWSPRIDTVSGDDATSVYLAAKVLRRRGYQRIGFFFSRWALVQSLNKLEMGALHSQKHISGLSDIPIGISERQKTQKDFLDVDRIQDEFIPWFQKYKPEAIICIGAVIKPLLEQKLGLRVPEDVGIVQYDWVPKPGLELAGIWHNKDLQAAYAVEALITKITHGIFGLPRHPVEVSFPPSWMEGPSIKRMRD